MLGKILLTAVIILIAFALLRQRAEQEKRERSGAGPATDQPATSVGEPVRSELSQDLRLGAYLFLALMVGLGAALYYFRWQDDHRVITVTLYRDGQQQPVSYEVYKYQLGERSFTTTEGVVVTVAGSERMEIEGLAE